MPGKQTSNTPEERPVPHIAESCGAPKQKRRLGHLGRRGLIIALCLIMALSCAGCSNSFMLRLLLGGSTSSGASTSTPTAVPTTEIIIAPPAAVPGTPASSVPTAVKVFLFDTERDDISMSVGETLKLSAQVYPTDAFCNFAIQWSVSDPTVLKVEPDAFGRTCNVTVLKHQPGGATLTASCSGAGKDVKIYTRVPVTTPTPVPATPAPAGPTAVKVFYFDRELDEFTQAVGEVLKLSAKAYPTESFANASFWWTVSDPSVMRLEPDANGRTCTLTVLKHQPGGVTLTVTCNGVSKNVKVYTKTGYTPSPAVVPGTPVKLEGELLYRINIFLSNFSEQGMQSFNSSTVSDDYLLRFINLYCKINHHNQISYIGGEECVSLQDANTYLNRFFTRSVSPYEGMTYYWDSWHTFRYSGGYFRYPAADGESYNYFTIVYEMTANSDGTYTVKFQNYELDLDEYWDHLGVDYSFYWLNNDQVAQLVWANRVTPVEGGTAVVRDYVFNGSTTYQILSYEVWGISFSH